MTEPADAQVFIDSVPAGLTPLRRSEVSAGTHRVKIVKDGYLENSRLIDVSHNRIASVTVKLTPSAGRAGELAAAQPATTASSGGVNKWIWIGAAGGAAVVTTLALTRNAEPVAGTIVATPPGTGMAGQTNYTFQSTATDPDKDTLTYSWKFGDGGSASGNGATHTYSAPGNYQVEVAISDGKHTVNAPSASVTVGPSLSGTWTGGSILMPDPTGAITVNCGLTLVLTQNGTSISGSMALAGGCSGGPGPLASGSASALTHPSQASVASGPFSFPGGALSQGLVISFSGTTNTAGTGLSGNVTLSSPAIGFVRTTATSFTRQ